MAISVQVQNVDGSGTGGIWVTGVLVASGNYVTGGDTVNFTAAVGFAAALELINAAQVIESSQPPFNLDIWSMAGNLTDTYFAVIGTNQTNCKLKIASAFGTELSAGAYPAAVTGDTIGFMAVFPKLL